MPRLRRVLLGQHLQGGYLSGPTALPASFSGIIMISYENSVHTAITPLKLAGSAVGPLRLPPCNQLRRDGALGQSASILLSLPSGN